MSRVSNNGLDEFVQFEIANQGLTGLAILVTFGGTPVYEGYFGFADLKNQTPVTEATVFEIASISKIFTATQVCQWSAQAQVDLDRHIQDFLPEFKIGSPSITLRHLLTHTSGLTDYADDTWVDFEREYPADELTKIVAEMPLVFEPGERFAYSNSNYFLLGEILTRACNRPWHRVVEEEQFRPLGMNTACLATRGAIAKGYIRKGGKLTEPGVVSLTLSETADGSLAMSLSDLKKFESHVSQNPQIWSERWQPARNGANRPLSYGLGWSIYRQGPSGVVGHAGQWKGFSATYRRHLGTGYSIVMLSNVENVNFGPIGKRLASQFKF